MEQGNPWCKSRSESKGPRTRSMDVQRQEKLNFLPQAESEFSIPLPFCSMWAFNRLDNAHSHCLPKWYVCTQSLLILMLISSGNTLTDKPRNIFIFFPAIWASLYVSSWHIKLTITPAFQVNSMVMNKIQFLLTALETFKSSQANVWANSGRWWRTGKPGVLQYMDRRVR